MRTPRNFMAVSVVFLYYRYIKVVLHHLRYISAELDGGNVCPACPKV